MLCRGSRGTVIRDFIFDAWEKVLVARYVVAVKGQEHVRGKEA